MCAGRSEEKQLHGGCVFNLILLSLSKEGKQRAFLFLHVFVLFFFVLQNFITILFSNWFYVIISHTNAHTSPHLSSTFHLYVSLRLNIFHLSSTDRAALILKTHCYRIALIGKIPTKIIPLIITICHVLRPQRIFDAQK